MLKLYIVWTGIYMPQILYEAYHNEGGFLHGLLKSVKQILIAGSYEHLWYLYASVIAVMLVTFFLWKKMKIEKIILVGCFLYAIGLLGDSYFGLLRPLSSYPAIWNLLKIYKIVFDTTRNGLFEGFLFVGIGVLFAYRDITMKIKTAATGFIISMVLMFIEAFSVRHFNLSRDHNMYIFLVPAIYFVFYIVTHIEMSGSVSTKRLRMYSSLIYFTHLWIKFPILSIIIKVIEKVTNIEDYLMHSLLSFAIVFSGALMVSILIVKLQSYKKFEWLKQIC